MKKLLKLIGKYKIFLAFSVIFAAISVVLQLYVPVLFGDAIDEVVSALQVNFDMMWYYLKQILIFIVISAFATWFMNLLNNRMTYRIVQDIRSQAIRHIQVLPLSYLDQHSTGDIVSRVIADTDILSDGLLLGFTQLFSGIVTIVVTLIFMFSKNVWVTLLVIVLTPFSFVVAKFISSRSYTMFRKQSDARGRQTALIEEMIGNQKIVDKFRSVRTQFDYGVFLPIQYGAAAALNGPQDAVLAQCEEYERRNQAFCGGLRSIGWDVPDSEGTMFVWAPLPKGYTSSEKFCMDLLENTGVLCTPGSAFGSEGEGHVRFALVLPPEEIKKAVEAVGAWL